ncbi:hypothetical protein [Desulfonatronovibrio magnus]|uniref:hypothetical protein n=1 Tax=Desulfonatronovibrio magnus TaxID=698827 RepID=UPI0005EB3CC9|nr:hypothetical protein [Desulfonatronovibrio magnus]
MFNEKFINELEKHLISGELEDIFKHSSEERRGEILDYLERIMELGDLADEVATKLIFAHSGLGNIYNSSPHK